MPKRRSGANQLLAQLSKLSLAAPQVVAHRVGRMAAAGPVLSARDRQEFTDMVLEKQLAFTQSAQSMWAAGAKANQELLAAWSRAMVQPLWFKPATGSRLVRQAQQAGLGVLSKGLAPIERKASANAKRLSKGRKG